jgi:hypothetical protein
MLALSLISTLPIMTAVGAMKTFLPILGLTPLYSMIIDILLIRKSIRCVYFRSLGNSQMFYTKPY